MIQPHVPEKKFNAGIIGIVLLVIAFAVSVAVSVVNTVRIERPPKPIVLIAHWQLERGYGAALQQVIDDYNALHPETEIKQSGISERLYTQWLNTQLISGTAPDLCQIGQGSIASKDEYTVRYFLPLSGEIAKPNPYNKGNDLENKSWKESLTDGMKGGFREGLQEYYGVPTTMQALRVFYNKDLLKKVLGHDNPPKTFGEWMQQCEAIGAYAAKIEDRKYRPLPVVSAYNLNLLQARYDPMFTSKFEPVADLDLNGDMTTLETYIAYKTGKVTLSDPEVKASFETLRLVGEQMQQGFSAMDRQEAQFRFVNGLAGFMYTGSWDASGIFSQAKEHGFEVGVINVPVVTLGDPNGQYSRGPSNEANSAGGGIGVYGVNKTSPNAEVALDFLRYLTSRSGNEKFTQAAEWPPITIGAKPSELMANFKPSLEGYSSRLQFNYGSAVSTRFGGELINYWQGDITYDQFVAAYDKVINDPYQGGDWAWWFEFDERRRDVRNKERVLAQQAVMALIDPASASPERYNRALLQQVMRNNAEDYPYMFRKYRGKEMPQF